VFFAAAVACSSSESRDAEVLVDAGAPDAGAPDAAGVADASATDASAIFASAYCETIGGFFCDFYLRCGRIASSDGASCAAYFAAACEGRFEPRYVALERAQLLSLSPEGIDACRAHLANVECARQIRDLDGPCARMWIGTVLAGGKCGLDVESFVCAPGTTCVLGLDFCGTCRPSAELDQSCAGEVVCDSAAECVQDVCVARPGVGDPCGTEPRCVVGASCSNGRCVGPSFVGADAACDRERRCVYETSCVEGACVLGGRIGDPCSASVPCAVGICANDRCAPLLDNGERCTSASDCLEGACIDQRCDSLPSACLR
jgi:hypothetical protein